MKQGKKENKFRCNNCKKLFSTKKGLATHQRTHSFWVRLQRIIGMPLDSLMDVVVSYYLLPLILIILAISITGYISNDEVLKSSYNETLIFEEASGA